MNTMQSQSQQPSKLMHFRTGTYLYPNQIMEMNSSIPKPIVNKTNNLCFNVVSKISSNGYTTNAIALQNKLCLGDKVSPPQHACDQPNLQSMNSLFPPASKNLYSLSPKFEVEKQFDQNGNLINANNIYFSKWWNVNSPIINEQQFKKPVHVQRHSTNRRGILKLHTFRDNENNSKLNKCGALKLDGKSIRDSLELTESHKREVFKNKNKFLENNCSHNVQSIRALSPDSIGSVSRKSVRFVVCENNQNSYDQEDSVSQPLQIPSNMVQKPQTNHFGQYKDTNTNINSLNLTIIENNPPNSSLFNSKSQPRCLIPPTVINTETNIVDCKPPRPPKLNKQNDLKPERQRKCLSTDFSNLPNTYLKQHLHRQQYFNGFSSISTYFNPKSFNDYAKSGEWVIFSNNSSDYYSLFDDSESINKSPTCLPHLSTLSRCSLDRNGKALKSKPINVECIDIAGLNEFIRSKSNISPTYQVGNPQSPLSNRVISVLNNTQPVPMVPPRFTSPSTNTAKCIPDNHHNQPISNLNATMPKKSGNKEKTSVLTGAENNSNHMGLKIKNNRHSLLPISSKSKDKFNQVPILSNSPELLNCSKPLAIKNAHAKTSLAINQSQCQPKPSSVIAKRNPPNNNAYLPPINNYLRHQQLIRPRPISSPLLSTPRPKDLPDNSYNGAGGKLYSDGIWRANTKHIPSNETSFTNKVTHPQKHHTTNFKESVNLILASSDSIKLFEETERMVQSPNIFSNSKFLSPIRTKNNALKAQSSNGYAENVSTTDVQFRDSLDSPQF